MSQYLLLLTKKAMLGCQRVYDVPAEDCTQMEAAAIPIETFGIPELHLLLIDRPALMLLPKAWWVASLGVWVLDNTRGEPACVKLNTDEFKDSLDAVEAVVLPMIKSTTAYSGQVGLVLPRLTDSEQQP